MHSLPSYQGNTPDKVMLAVSGSIELDMMQHYVTAVRIGDTFDHELPFAVTTHKFSIDKDGELVLTITVKAQDPDEEETESEAEELA